MVHCSILQCQNQSRHKNLSDGVTFHRFPNNPIRRAKWIRATGRRNWQPSVNSFICSEHFEFKGANKGKNKQNHIREVAVPNKNVTIFHKLMDIDEVNNLKEEPDDNETIEYMDEHGTLNTEETSQICEESNQIDTQTKVEKQKDSFPTLQELKLTAQLRWTKLEVEEQNSELKNVKNENALLKRKITAVESLIQAKKDNVLSNEDIVNLMVKQLQEIDKEEGN